MAKSYFAVLELPSSATGDEIRSAYRRLAKVYHCDHYAGGSKPFRRIQEAYAVLGDPERRKVYQNGESKARKRRPSNYRSYSVPEPLIPESKTVDLGGISPVRSFETF